MRHLQYVSRSRTTPISADLSILGARALIALLTEVATLFSMISLVIKGDPLPAGGGDGGDDGHDDEH